MMEINNKSINLDYIDQRYANEITYDTFHGMCFSRTGLPICKYSTVVTRQDIRDNTFGCFIVDLLLSCIWLKYFVEQVHFTLKYFICCIILQGYQCSPLVTIHSSPHSSPTTVDLQTSLENVKMLCHTYEKNKSLFLD